MEKEKTEVLAHANPCPPSTAADFFVTTVLLFLQVT
jgi:hypothetical protein